MTSKALEEAIANKAADQEVAVTDPEVASLDKYRHLVELEALLRETTASWQERLDQVQAELKELVGNAEEATFEGKKVFTYARINRLREKDFRKAYPTLAGVYTDLVEVEKLNVDALRTGRPDLYREFQTRAWKRVD